MNVRQAVEENTRHKNALRHSPILFAFHADASHSAPAAVYSIILCTGNWRRHRIVDVTVAESIQSPLCLFRCNN